MEVAFENIRQAEGITEVILPLKNKLEKKFNLSPSGRQRKKHHKLTWNKVMRICLIASLSLPDTRSIKRTGQNSIIEEQPAYYAQFLY